MLFYMKSCVSHKRFKSSFIVIIIMACKSHGIMKLMWLKEYEIDEIAKYVFCKENTIDY